MPHSLVSLVHLHRQVNLEATMLPLVSHHCQVPRQVETTGSLLALAMLPRRVWLSLACHPSTPPTIRVSLVSVNLNSPECHRHSNKDMVNYQKECRETNKKVAPV